MARTASARAISGCKTTARFESLQACFGSIRNPARRRTLWRGTAARAVTPGSVMRVFWPTTRMFVVDHLVTLDIDGLPRLGGQKAYRRWFVREVHRLGHTIDLLNRYNEAIRPGVVWGHAAKILNLYVREVACYRPYFSRRQADRIESWLYVPIDCEVLENLSLCNAPQEPKRICDVATRRQFFRIQQAIGLAARQERCRRIWFDDLRGETDRD